MSNHIFRRTQLWNKTSGKMQTWRRIPPLQRTMNQLGKLWKGRKVGYRRRPFSRGGSRWPKIIMGWSDSDWNSSSLFNGIIQDGVAKKTMLLRWCFHYQAEVAHIQWYLIFSEDKNLICATFQWDQIHIWLNWPWDMNEVHTSLLSSSFSDCTRWKDGETADLFSWY